VESQDCGGLVQGEGGAAVTPPNTPASELRGLLQIMLAVVELCERNGLVAVPLSVVDTWVVRLRRIVAQLDA
jgi:hypothetical protein